jgi:glycosyltransferase involved in cell wall biosynthesis
MTAVKFSVLLPTRDRLELAKGAIATVRAQSYQNWEIVVADNCSTDDVAGYVRSLADPRVVYTRSDTFIPVTENWNRALAASSGDLVVMLGDDDALVPGYFERMLAAMSALEQPDFIFHGAYQFSFPRAVPEYPSGAIADVTRLHSILWDLHAPSLLSAENAEKAGRASLDMRARYGFNMQYFLFARSFLQRMSVYGKFFQGPFPDFYAANMCMLRADRIGLVPEPMVVIGISPKSYGFYHFNKKEEGGIAFLNADKREDDLPPALRGRMLPGTNMLNSWLHSVALIPERLPDRPELAQDLQRGIARYRLLQVQHNMIAKAAGQQPEVTLKELWPRLRLLERTYALALAMWLWPVKWLDGRLRSRWLQVPTLLLRQHLRPPSGRPRPVVGRCKEMRDVYDYLAAARTSEPALQSKIS